MPVRFTLNRSGVRELLRSDMAMQACHEFAQQVADRAGDGYELNEYVGDKSNRVNVSVGAVTKVAKQDNYDNNTLLKALGG